MTISNNSSKATGPVVTKFLVCVEPSGAEGMKICSSCQGHMTNMSTMPIYGKNLLKIFPRRGWSGGVMVLGKLPVPGCPTIWITVGQGPTALAVGSGGGCLDIFTLIYPFSPFSLSLGDSLI